MKNETVQMQRFPPLVLFTDLDGTLLDHYSYSFESALPALNALSRLNIPWIPNTSKTFAELRVLRTALNHQDPFVVENGAALYLPLASAWAIASMSGSGFSHSETSRLYRGGEFLVCRFGVERKQLLRVLAPFRDMYRFRSFSEMSIDELVELTGLSRNAASLALDRDYSEPLLWQDTDASLDELRNAVTAQGFSLVRGGRFVHLMGRHSKADAIRWMANVAHQLGIKVKTLALGDGENDIEMLQAADIAVVVRSPSHVPIKIPSRERVLVTEGFGPVGWNQAVLSTLKDFLDEPAV